MYVVTRIPAGYTLDAKLDDDYRGAGLLEIKGQRSRLDAKVMHSGSGLHFGIRVTDPEIVVSSAESKPWQQDSVEVFIDPTGDGGRTMSGSDIQILISPQDIQLSTIPKETISRILAIDSAAGCWLVEMIVPMPADFNPEGFRLGLVLNDGTEATMLDGQPPPWRIPDKWRAAKTDRPPKPDRPPTTVSEIDLGAEKNSMSTTLLEKGGKASYDASRILKRLVWTGQSSGTATRRSETSNQFLFRFGAPHDGGHLRGPTICGNLLPTDDYDTDRGWPLYPTQDGGQVYFGSPHAIRNFTVLEGRFHSCWDPIRPTGKNPEIDKIKVHGCWATLVRDDFVENDQKHNVSILDCLVGDEIDGLGGCFVFLSGTSGRDYAKDKEIDIADCLVWSSLMRATKRPRGITVGGVKKMVCGTLFKIQNLKVGPRINVKNTVFMVDHLSFGAYNGDPLGGLKALYAYVPGECRDNVLIWRDLGKVGKYPFDLPKGFTLMERGPGEAFWADKVLRWKAAHPGVRRLNERGIKNAFDKGSHDVVDTN